MRPLRRCPRLPGDVLKHPFGALTASFAAATRNQPLKGRQRITQLQISYMQKRRLNDNGIVKIRNKIRYGDCLDEVVRYLLQDEFPGRKSF